MTAPIDDTGTSPYKGLAPFEDSDLDALLFFGRDGEREVITANLQASRLTVLYGPSGCGKSSVLRAGVAHALRRQAEANLEEGREPEHAVVVFDRWSDDPAEGIAAAVAEAITPLAGALPAANGPLPLSEQIGAWARRLGGELYLILDQAEEYFLYRPTDEEDDFARELPELVGRPDLPVNVLVSLREDALGRLDVFRPGIPALFANTLRLALLDGSAARDAVVGPLGRYADFPDAAGPIAIEPELVEAVLSDTRAGEIELAAGAPSGLAVSPGEGVETAFLQLVLARLWQTERDAGSSTLRLETFQRLGGAERIVQDHLGAALAAFTPEQRDAAAAAFNHLVTPSGTKVAHGLEDLATYSGVAPAFLAPVLTGLAEQRILRPLPPADGSTDPRYEIFHDVLAGPILGWRAEHETERRLAGERAEAKRRHRRLLGVTIASLVGLAIAVGLAIFALTQRSEAREQAALARGSLAQAEDSREQAEESEAEARASEDEALRNADEASQAQAEAEDQARIARARQLAAVATVQLATDPELSIILALDAVELERSPDIVDVLRQSLLASRVRLELRAEGPINAASYSPNGSLILTASDDGTARVYDNETGDPVTSLDHGAPVNAAAFSPDGRFVATASDDGTARLWPVDGASPEDEQVVLQHQGPVTSLDFDTEGAFLATGSRDGMARIWDVATGTLLHELPHPAAVTIVAFDPEGAKLATAAEDYAVRVFTAAGSPIGELQHRATVTSISWRNDSVFLATTSGDRTAMLWLPTLGDTQKLTGPEGPFLTGEFNPRGQRLATGSSDGAVRTWIVPGGMRRDLWVAHPNRVTDVSYNTDGSYLVTASRDRTARVWNAATGALLTTLAGHTDVVVSAVFNKTSGEVLTAGAEGEARVWDSSVLPDLLPLGPRHRGRVFTASFSHDGSLAVSAGADRKARIWRIDGSAPPIVLRHRALVSDASFSVDDRTVLTGSDDGTARLWRTEDGALVRGFRAGAPVATAALSTDGSLVAAGSDDGWTRLWRADSDEPIFEIRHRAAVTSVAFSHEGSRLVSASAEHRANAKILDTATGEVVAVLRGHTNGLVEAVFSPDDQLVATASRDDTARLWDAATGRLLYTLKGHHDDLTSVCFSRDGHLVLTTSEDSDGRTWDAATGESRQILRVHLAGVADASFSPDGDWIVTAGPKAAAIVNAETGQALVFPLLGHRGPLTSASFSPDGRHVLTSGTDGTVRTYDCEACAPPDELIAIAEARLAETGRQLKPAEEELLGGE